MASESESEKRETLADIVREMRKLGELDEKSTDRIKRSLMGLGLRTYADRLEAAWKREREAVEADALSVGGIVEAARHKPGNAAALREALEGMCKASQDVFRSFARETFAGERRLDSLGGAFDKAKAALSEPARNCDLFGGDPKMLNTAWFDWTASPSGHDANGAAKMTFARWLLAPAAERKEEDYGK